MAQYLLQQNVYLCLIDGTAILLNLPKDEYIGLSAEQADALSTVVKGWPINSQTEARDSAKAIELAESLAKKELLTRNAAKGKEASLVAFPTPQTELLEQIFTPELKISHVWHFFIAYVKSRVLLRRGNLDGFFLSIRARKSLHECLAPVDDQCTKTLTRIFFALRPFFYTHKNMCLLDSLVLVEFLARYRQFPTFLIGVRANPFGAHSWVQIGDCVLSGHAADYVRRFRPILAI